MKKETDILETTLSIAENGYSEAYHFLLDAYEKNIENYGPQTLYFLACLAGGANMPEKSVNWLRKAITDNRWWYRPEVLADDDLELLKDNSELDYELDRRSGGCKTENQERNNLDEYLQWFCKENAVK